MLLVPAFKWLRSTNDFGRLAGSVPTIVLSLSAGSDSIFNLSDASFVFESAWYEYCVYHLHFVSSSCPLSLTSVMVVPCSLLFVVETDLDTSAMQ